jgi:hypothetical protein
MQLEGSRVPATVHMMDKVGMSDLKGQKWWVRGVI